MKDFTACTESDLFLAGKILDSAMLILSYYVATMLTSALALNCDFHVSIFVTGKKTFFFCFLLLFF